MKQIYALQQEETSIERKARLDNIITFMNTPAETAVNIEGINAVRQQAHAIVNERKEEIADIQDKILNQYDEFIQSLQTSLVSDETSNATL